MRQLATSTLSNQNISSAVLAHTYTADADRAILIRVVIDQVIGTGDYTAYVTLQELGAGSFYKTGVYTLTAAAGVTAIIFPSIILPVNNTDVVRVYVTGLATDTTTPDIITRIFELTYLRPTTAGATLDVSGTGEAGVDLSNIKQATGATTLTNITVPVVASVTALAANAIDAAAIKDAAIDAATFAAGAIDAAAIADDAIDAGSIKADAVTKIQAGLSTLTAAQVWSYATRTLSSFGTLVANIWDELIAGHLTAGTTGKALGDAGAAGDPWAAATRTLTSTAAATLAAVTGSTLNITAAVSYSATLSGLTIPATWTKMLFTIKRTLGDTDAESVVQIVESNPGVGTDGLKYLNGAAGTAAQASLTVTQATGVVDIVITDEATAALSQASQGYDLKVLLADGTSQILTAGACEVSLTETKSIT